MRYWHFSYTHFIGRLLSLLRLFDDYLVAAEEICIWEHIRSVIIAILNNQPKLCTQQIRKDFQTRFVTLSQSGKFEVIVFVQIWIGFEVYLCDEKFFTSFSLSRYTLDSFRIANL